MKLCAPAWFAAASVLLLVPVQSAATVRPRYGGTVRVQLVGPMPSFQPSDARASLRDRALLHLVAQTLTRLNVRGEPEPQLAVSWQSDAEKKRWRFALRPGVTMHDGAQLNPAAVAAALKGFRGLGVTATSRGLQIASGQPVPDLPLLLADPGAAIAGTGPFQVAQSSPLKTVLTAFEQHWAGRPFVDSIEFLPPRSGPLSLASAELWESPGGTRRALPEGARTWQSSPCELLALDMSAVSPSVAEALSASIDRESLAAVLTQRRAEPAFGLLPQWISGYGFVFAKPRDVAHAQQLVAGMMLAPMGVTFANGDAFARIVADRIAVNARDAGIVLTLKPGVDPHIRIIRFPLVANATHNLRELATAVNLPEHVRFERSEDPDLNYGAERMLIESNRLVPLMHLPLIFGVHPKIAGLEQGTYTVPVLALESVWVMP